MNGVEDIRARLGIRLVFFSTIALVVLAIFIVVGGGIAEYKSQTGGPFKDTTQLLLSSLLPLFGTWVGTLLAFYFSRENFKAAAESGTALEINASFPRLDLSDASAYGAIKAGVKLSIDTDAHSIEQLDAMQFGIFVAQRAWATAGDVINCMTPAKLLEFIRRKRG